MSSNRNQKSAPKELNAALPVIDKELSLAAAEEECKKAGFNWSTIHDLEKVSDRGRVVDTLSAAALMLRRKVSENDIFWVIKRTKTLPTNAMYLLAIAISSVEDTNMAVEVYEHLQQHPCSAEQIQLNGVLTPGSVNEKDVVYQAALAACLSQGLTTEQIDELVQLAGKGRVLAALRAAAILFKENRAFAEVKCLVKATTDCKNNVLLALGMMFADYSAFTIAMEIYDKLQDAPEA